MDVSEAQLANLAEQYVAALAGGEIIQAIKFHAGKAEVNLNFIILDATEISAAQKVFRAAHAQKKLEILIKIIQQDGFQVSIIIPIVSENTTQELITPHVAIFTEDKYRSWIQSETEYVDIRGIGQRKAEDVLVFPILELYTELYVQTGLSNLDLEKGRMRGSQRISLTEMVNVTRCLLIMGDPGSGKTTFLKFIARKYIEEKRDYLPIYIRLADVYDYARKNSLPLDADIVEKYFIQLCNIHTMALTQQIFDEKASKGKWLWLLDSLDELSSDTSREEMVKVVEETAKKWSSCKFVITSRPLPLRGKSIPIGFDRVGIDNWSKGDIRSFLQAWTKLLQPKANEETRKRHWGNLLATIVNRPDLRTLAKNAVMVTAMAVVHHNETKLPEGRAELLKALIYWLIRAKTRPTNYLYGEFSFIENRHKELALAMLEMEGGRRRQVGRLWAAEKISKHCQDDVDAALEFLTKEETETGVLVRRGEGDLEFWHLSFQEYLAAEEIAGKTDDQTTGWWSKIKDKLDESEWREVIIFVPLCLNRLGTERVNLFFERLAESCATSDLLTKARRVALGGSILRDLSLTGYKLNDIPTWNKILEDIAPIFTSNQTGIPLEVRCEAAIAYGLGGDVRLRDFEETWIPISGGTFVLGAQSRDDTLPNYDVDAASWEGPPTKISVNDFDIRKYPITVEEFKQFVDDDVYQTQSFWSEDGWNWLISEEHLMPLDWEEQLLAPNCPVTGISWFEAQAYCNWLTLRDIRDIEYRLPSEPEWEYAAKRRLKPGQKFPWGSKVTPGDQAEANFAWTGLRKKTPVGIFPKCVTEDGIVDMFGNVEEWCADSWTSNHTLRPPKGQAITNDAEECIVRGGSTIRFSRLCRPTYRSRIAKNKRYHPVGFRPVRVWKSDEDKFDKPKQQVTVGDPKENHLAAKAVDLISTQEKQTSNRTQLNESKYSFIETVDYSSIGDGSLWGTGEHETIEAINNLKSGGRWLDLASGDGRYSIQMLDRCDRLVALDIDSNALSKLIMRASGGGNHKLSIVQANLLSIPFEKNIFDVIVCTGILHLFPQQILAQIVDQIDYILKPKGILILDFATDKERYYNDGRLLASDDETSYKTDEALDLLGELLKNYEFTVRTSTFEDNLSETEGYGYISRGKFVLVNAKKRLR